MPSLYDAIKTQPRQHTYIFIGFADNEEEDIGSHFYAKHMMKDQIAVTDAMVNMDSLGLASTEVWASHSDRRLTNEIVYMAKLLNLPISGVNVEQIGSTDSEQFVRKIPSITLTLSLKTAGTQASCIVPKTIFLLSSWMITTKVIS